MAADEHFNEAPAHEFLRTESISGRRSSRKVKTLIDSMSRDGWTGGPIIAFRYGREKYILDGHHRVYAARIAKIDVLYEEIDVERLKTFRYNSVDEVVQAHAEARPNRIILR